MERVPLSLASVLKNCKPQDIGMSPDHIPSWVQVHLPISLIRPQLASGCVTVRVVDVMAALEPELRNLITPSRPDLSVDLPMAELQQALPKDASTPEPAPAPSPISPLPPSAIPAQIFAPSPAVVEKSTSPDLVFGVPSRSTSLASTFDFPMEKTEIIAPPPSLKAPEREPGPEHGVPPEPVAEPVASAPEPVSPFSFLKDDPEITASVPAEREVGPAPTLPAPSFPAPAPVSTGIPKSAIRVTPPARPPVPGQMLLRALLNTAVSLDTSTVVELTAGLPGIVAVACLHEDGCAASAGDGSPEAGHFLQQAPKLHQHVQPLIALTGGQDSETFSMNSGQLVVTFSQRDGVTLGVLHDPRRQEPAFRDKVTLITRELASMLEAEAA